MRRTRRLAWLLAPIAAAGALVLPTTGSSAVASPAGLRLVASERHIDIDRFQGDTSLYLPSAVYVAPTGGSFELDAYVHRDGSVAIWQVRRDTAGVHRVRQIAPAGPVSVADGLPNFFRLTMRDSAGHVVSSATAPFCPGNGLLPARIDAGGPDRPTFPYYCGSSMTRATVWGIDRGWAVAPFLGLPDPGIADGAYRVVVRITNTYINQLHLDPARARVSLGATVTTPSGGICGPGFPCARGSHARMVARQQRARAALTAGSWQPVGGTGLPDLAALPAHDLSILSDDSNHDFLAFGATIWNAGPGPLVVEGFRPGGAPEMNARQFVYRNGRPVASYAVGTFEFDTRVGHHHWHMEDVAQYDLLSADGSRLILSDKQSFCLAPTDPVDLTIAGAQWQPDRVGLVSACPTDDSIWLRETMPVGWGDTYVQSAGGQSFDITDLPNGRYQIRVTTNPFHHIHETTFADNSARQLIRLGGSNGQRTVEMLGTLEG
ncbi:MAG TPA: lysyl oxidase family protein [Mycobacteriales bacterium]|nr:lysyl oxidase family protein [Mycobacteriales bacterium]